MITKDELAANLNGREYMKEITTEEVKLAKESGLLVVFGSCDDLVEFRGAFDDEVGCYEGCEIKMNNTGIIRSLCPEGESCPYFKELSRVSRRIKAIWDKSGYSWFIVADGFSHAVFDIFDDGEKYCRGVVIDLE
jgi:hypothetical protein